RSLPILLRVKPSHVVHLALYSFQSSDVDRVPSVPLDSRVTSQHKTEYDWLFRFLISASIHGHFRAMPHESVSCSRGYGHTHPILKGSKGVPTGIALGSRIRKLRGRIADHVYRLRTHF